jgi:K+-transporting ATPase c subunit
MRQSAAMQLLPMSWPMRTGSALPRLDSNNSRPGKPQRDEAAAAARMAILQTRIALPTIESINNSSSGNENNNTVDNDGRQVNRISSTRSFVETTLRWLHFEYRSVYVPYLRTVLRFSGTTI